MRTLKLFYFGTRQQRIREIKILNRFKPSNANSRPHTRDIEGYMQRATDERDDQSPPSRKETNPLASTATVTWKTATTIAFAGHECSSVWGLVILKTPLPYPDFRRGLPRLVAIPALNIACLSIRWTSNGNIFQASTQPRWTNQSSPHSISPSLRLRHHNLICHPTDRQEFTTVQANFNGSNKSSSLTVKWSLARLEIHSRAKARTLHRGTSVRRGFDKLNTWSGLFHG